MNNTINKLKNEFDKVKLKHIRDKNSNKGLTIACLWKNDMRYFGLSICNKKDQFSKRMGREIALNRAKFAATTLGVKEHKDYYSFILCGNSSNEEYMFDMNNGGNLIIPKHLYT